jgi:hypothetical protein
VISKRISSVTNPGRMDLQGDVRLATSVGERVGDQDLGVHTHLSDARLRLVVRAHARVL